MLRRSFIVGGLAALAGPSAPVLPAAEPELMKLPVLELLAIDSRTGHISNRQVLIGDRHIQAWAASLAEGCTRTSSLAHLLRV